MAIAQTKRDPTSSLCPSARKRKRDHTIIPVRLVNRKRVIAMEETGSDRMNPSLIASNEIVNKISRKAVRCFPLQDPRSVWFRVALLAVVAMAPFTSNCCHCTSTKLDSDLKVLDRPGSSTDSYSHKDNLLSSISDSIEQQHFRLSKPSRTLLSGQSRPSKFDSSAESYIDLAHSMGSFGQLGLPANKVKSDKKVDDGMRQILSMHEQAFQQPANSLSSTRPQESERSAMANAKGRLRRWRGISRSPVRVATSLIRPNRLVSQVLSYIQPLVGTKFLNTLASSLEPATNGSNPFSIGKLKLHQFSPFVGRSSTNYASLNHEYNIFGPLKPSRQSPTASPQTSSLVRPPNSGASGSAIKGATATTTASMDNNSAESKLPQSGKSPINEDSEEIKDLMTDSSSLSNIISSSSHSMLWSSGSPEAEQVKTDSPRLTPINKPTNKPAGLKSPFFKPSTTTGTSSWLRNSANQLAQNYFQNSFRDLITLSQLPILSSSTISTAPSVLEKKQSPANNSNNHSNNYNITKNRQNKNSIASPSVTNSDDFRRRAIEELYRYAYIIATGVRNKRDPLMALSSKPKPSLSGLRLTKRGQHSQRSLNQLIASNQTTQQLMNLARKLKALLAAGPMNRARPRGVMWDMATDPSLGVTLFHLLERASVALPLGE